MKKETSIQLYAKAQKVMPGGVNSPVRAFNAVGGEPWETRMQIPLEIFNYAPYMPIFVWQHVYGMLHAPI